MSDFEEKLYFLFM